ncbi:MAG: competence/damage-inducible protein A [Acidobacteria bacterium]|nr:competence/damage-inducible protein A [Acidobacteriota bacterium]
MDAAVIVVGDEILSGHVRDANGHFIARRLAAHGHRLLSISIVPDETEAIAAGVRRDAERARLVFVCGGVGPTHDDRTMEGVALAAGEPLEVCAPISARVEGIAERLRSEGVGGGPLGLDGLRKMALTPRGAEALLGSAGFIPAVALPVGDAVVVVLPGPPRELEAVFREAVEPKLLAGTGEPVRREEVSHPFPESAVAGVLVEIERECPEVKVGSYPMEGHSLVRITGPDSEVIAAAVRLRASLERLEGSVEGRRLLEVIRARAARRDGGSG